MYKKIILSVLAVVAIVISAHAQVKTKSPSRTPGLRGSLSVHTNLDPYTIYDFPTFGNFVKGIKSMKQIGMAIPSMGVGLNGGFTGRWITIEMNGRVDFGTAFVKGVIPQEKVDLMFFADFGIRLLKLWIMELEVTGGFGACFPNVSLKNSTTEPVTPNGVPQLSYLKDRHFIVPISAIVWFGGVRRARHRVGISLEYIMRVGKFTALPSSPIDAMGDITEQITKAPATFNASLRYQF